jgi:hypothetical protein
MCENRLRRAAAAYRPARAALAAVAVAALVAGCTAEPRAEPGAGSPTGTSSPSRPAEAREPVLTENFDSIAVLGHSGATGTLTDPTDYRRDARENSWATGENPEVRSLYLRLLETHPALQGHNYNEAVGGTGVDNLLPQFDYLLDEADPLPDLVIIQTIDNDMRCDGSDPDNYASYAATLDQTLTRIEQRIPGVQFFIVSQSITVKRWTAWAAHHRPLVRANSGTGPCDVFDESGRPRPAGMRSMQRIVDSYWQRIETVCAAHPECYTDGAAEQRTFRITDRDVAIDLNHPSVAGHRKFAAIAWQALPEEITGRP